MGKRTKQPRQWILTWCRPVGEFKNGERRMLKRQFRHKEYAHFMQAVIGRSRFKEDIACVGFIYKKGRKPRKIVELEVFPEDYSGE